MLVLTWVMLGSLNHAVARSGHSGRGRQPGDLSQLMAKYGRVSIPAPKSAQDSLIFKRLFDLSLTQGQAYSRLGELCKGVGPRLSGSDNAERGIEWAVDMLKSYRFDTVFTQPGDGSKMGARGNRNCSIVFVGVDSTIEIGETGTQL